MHKFDRVYDITVALGLEAPVYPGDPAYERSLVFSMNRGDEADVSRLALCSHSGTHIDLPAHFIQLSPTVEALPPEEFILPVRVIEVADPLVVTAEELAGYDLSSRPALLCKTRNSTSGLVVTPQFSEEYVYFSAEAAEHCVMVGLRLVGLDYYSVDGFGAEGYPAHRILLEAGLYVLEGINLAAVPPGDYTLICLPLRLDGCEASPVRAVLLK
ncbi:MAG: cyclase family protein [Candidatus Glassbacteria bacterium]